MTRTSFIGRLPVSVAFDLALQCCLVTSSTAHSLSHSGLGSRFTEILTASYEGLSSCSLMSFLSIFICLFVALVFFAFTITYVRYIMNLDFEFEWEQGCVF